MRATLLLLSMSVLLLTAPLTAADPSHDAHITVVGYDDPSECGESTFCLEFEGAAPDLAPGDFVKVTFRNDGGSPHNLMVATAADADEGGNTPESAVINGTETINPGEEASFTFTVPDDAEGVYYWCDVSGHEQLGMWLDQGVSASMDGGDGGDGTDGTDGMDGGDQTNGSPFAGALTVALIVVVAAVLMARRD